MYDPPRQVIGPVDRAGEPLSLEFPSGGGSDGFVANAPSRTFTYFFYLLRDAAVLLDLTEDQLFDVRGKSRAVLPVIPVLLVITQLEEAEALPSCSQGTLVAGWQHEAGRTGRSKNRMEADPSAAGSWRP